MDADSLESKMLAVVEGSGESCGEGSKRVAMLGKGDKFSNDGFDGGLWGHSVSLCGLFAC